MDEFTDIVIVDLDVNRTTWSRVHSSMRTLHLKLNRDPDAEWTRLFFEERNARVELKRHGLWAEDGYIIFDCLLIDVDDYHLPDIRQSIDYANARSRVLGEARYIEAERLRGEAQSEQHMLTSLRASIRAGRAQLQEPVPVEANDVTAASVAAETVTEIDEFVPPEPAAEPVHAEREAVLEARRNDWRARFRAALQRKK